MVGVSTGLLAAFVALSAVDGVYVHLWRLRLHARADSWREHVFHTGRAVLFAPVLVAVFAAQTGGALLWAGVALLALDQAAEVADGASERASRASLGGLSTGEYLLHGALVTLRAVAVALALASRPAHAWALDAPWVLAPHPPAVAWVVRSLVPGSVAMAALHVWLAVRHRPGAPRGVARAEGARAAVAAG